MMIDRAAKRCVAHAPGLRFAMTSGNLNPTTVSLEPRLLSHDDLLTDAHKQRTTLSRFERKELTDVDWISTRSSLHRVYVGQTRKLDWITTGP